MVKQLLVVSLASAVVLWSTAFAGTVNLPGMGGGLQVEVSSFKEQRFSSVIQQQYDFSCGSAAIASLLSYHYSHDVSEQSVFSAMFALADPEKVRKDGFSMLDMKRFLESEGYQADGFRMPLSGIREKVSLPVIVLMNLEGFRHFVVIKGISDDEVLVGDPARGLKAYSRAEFEGYWDGTAFVIRSHVKQGRSTFLAAGDWPKVVRAPLDKGQDGPSLGHTLPYWPSTREW
ncbi:MAG: C39 family peptidase [Gammaproteobacteria bacterium]|uniref:Lactococcin-G-processing and transport ATP-binding protein LagD n=1 Tax=Marinobacter litoralis TaxID=187981 RepID=A0A3M2RI28_9GAMM|nr:C39 family peptidase [Marinobacter litoralis]MBR9871952.1 C39 family peptidase [Gammaproteobacteria bacterium]RMJ04585.1 Lactococcin-G-processing and transport ATP-binding protein LagD [Marinobacter litoralis]